jgi:hypothetical protein
LRQKSPTERRTNVTSPTSLLFDAGIGRKEEAIPEARRAIDLVPMAKDALYGPSMLLNLALVYTWTGERNLAIAFPAATLLDKPTPAARTRAHKTLGGTIVND